MGPQGFGVSHPQILGLADELRSARAGARVGL